MLIGIAGAPRAGKNTAGEALEQSGFVQVSFAHRLKQVCSDLYGIPMAVFETDAKDIPWESNSWTPRAALIALGMAAREIEPNVWSQYVLDRVEGDTVITDVRFQNEVSLIVAAGGVIFRVIRPGYAQGTDVGDIDWSATPHVRLENNHTVLALVLDTQQAARVSRSILEDLQ